MADGLRLAPAAKTRKESFTFSSTGFPLADLTAPFTLRQLALSRRYPNSCDLPNPLTKESPSLKGATPARRLLAWNPRLKSVEPPRIRGHKQNTNGSCCEIALSILFVLFLLPAKRVLRAHSEYDRKSRHLSVKSNRSPRYLRPKSDALLLLLQVER